MTNYNHIVLSTPDYHVPYICAYIQSVEYSDSVLLDVYALGMGDIKNFMSQHIMRAQLSQ